MSFKQKPKMHFRTLQVLQAHGVRPAHNWSNSDREHGYTDLIDKGLVQATVRITSKGRKVLKNFEDL